MSSSKDYLEFILDQLSSLDEISYKANDNLQFYQPKRKERFLRRLFQKIFWGWSRSTTWIKKR